MAASTFNVMEGRVEATKREVKEEQWGLVDFLGKYHKHIIKSENPIPGTAVAADDRRERAWSDRLASIRGRIEDIEERHGANVRGRVSHPCQNTEQFQAYKCIIGRVNLLSRVQAVVLPVRHLLPFAHVTP